MSDLQAGEALAASVQKTPNRVTLADLEAKVKAERYHNPDIAPELTICVLLLVNGFTLVGKSAPADPANFDPKAGRKFARDDALRQLWPLEGYRLRETLHQEGAPDHRAARLADFWESLRTHLLSSHVDPFQHDGPEIVRSVVKHSIESKRIGITQSEADAFIQEYFR